MYKLFTEPQYDAQFDRPNISVLPFEEIHEAQTRQLLLETLPEYFNGIDSSWVESLFDGYRRRSTGDINLNSS